MPKLLSAKHIFIAVLIVVILIGIGSLYYLKHLADEKVLEKERALRLGYQQWHLPEGAKARVGAGTIRAMQYSPDGNLLAVVGDIGVWIFNAQTAAPQHLLAAHTGAINSIAFSPEGSSLVVGTENGTVQLWNTDTGKHQKTLTRREYRFGIDKVSFLSDSRTVVVVSSHSTMVDVWDIATGERKTGQLTIRLGRLSTFRTCICVSVDTSTRLARMARQSPATVAMKPFGSGILQHAKR